MCIRDRWRTIAAIATATDPVDTVQTVYLVVCVKDIDDNGLCLSMRGSMKQWTGVKVGC